MKRTRSIAMALMVAISLVAFSIYADPTEETTSSDTGIKAPMETMHSDQQQRRDTDNKEQEQRGGSKANQRESKQRDTKKDKQSAPWLSMIALILGAGGVALGGLNLKNVTTLQEKLDKLRERNKKMLPDLKGRVEFLEQELALARKKIEKNELDISRLNASIRASQHTQDQKYNSLQDQPIQQHYQPTAAPTHQTVEEPVRLYCGVPKGGLFTNATRNQSRQSLYVIIDNGSCVGKYSFVDGRESAMVAARSTSDFLDPGCIISGNQNSNFSRVRTITPGTVRKTSTGWRIESKAVVELI